MSKPTTVCCVMRAHEDCTYESVQFQCHCGCHGLYYRVRWWFRRRFV